MGTLAATPFTEAHTGRWYNHERKNVEHHTVCLDSIEPQELGLLYTEWEESKRVSNGCTERSGKVTRTEALCFWKHTAEMFVNELRFPSSAHVQRQGFHEDLLTLYGTGGVDCKTALLTLVKDSVIIH